MADTMLPECRRAEALTSKAKDSGDASDHKAAALAHDKAAKASFKAGNPSAAKYHLRKAKGHRANTTDPKATPLAFAAMRAKGK
jgi:hypothetical protein